MPDASRADLEAEVRSLRAQLDRLRAVFDESAAHPGMYDPHGVILQIGRLLKEAEDA